MKKTLIAHIGLMSAAVALATTRSPNAAAPLVLTPNDSGEQTNEIKLKIAPIVTREMLAGTQPKLKPGTTRRPQGVNQRTPFTGLRLSTCASIPATLAHVPQVTTSRAPAAAHA